MHVGHRSWCAVWHCVAACGCTMTWQLPFAPQAHFAHEWRWTAPAAAVARSAQWSFSCSRCEMTGHIRTCKHGCNTCKRQQVSQTTTETIIESTTNNRLKYTMTQAYIAYHSFDLDKCLLILPSWGSMQTNTNKRRSFWVICQCTTQQYN